MSVYPLFDAPPVVETAISISFTPIEGFTSAHAGALWDRRLRARWRKPTQASPMQVIRERFDSEGFWRARTPSFLLQEPGLDTRLQFVDSDDERMIQVQSSAFAYNWRRQKAEYPSFSKLLPEFESALDTFCAYLEEEGFRAIELNQWEVTYVNHVERGELWSTVLEWDNVLPGAPSVARNSCGGEVESLGLSWIVRLRDDRGRLRVTVSHGRTLGARQEELMEIRLVARGPVIARSELLDCLEVGHDAVTGTFNAITSPAAQQHWGRHP